MKKQILASVLASVLAISSVYAWGFGGSSKEKPNYDYSGEKELMSLSSFSDKDLRIDDAKFVYKKGAKILKKEFAYSIAEPKILEEAKEFTQKPNQLFLNDMQKLGRLLDILCTF